MAAHSRRRVLVIGTLDTKGAELAFLATSLSSHLARIHAPPLQITLVDVSASSPSPSSSSSSTPLADRTSGDAAGATGSFPIVPVSEILAAASAATSAGQQRQQQQQLTSLPADRAGAVALLSTGLRQYLGERSAAGEVAGAVGVGGSGGSSLIAPALRRLPLGVPKMLVSTMASGNTAPLVGTSDLLLVPSIVDVAGLNSILRTVLTNAAAAFAGWLLHSLSPSPLPRLTQGKGVVHGGTGEEEEEAVRGRAAVGVTMFGVTTPCVTEVQRLLHKRGVDAVVFHATGTGGQAMEELVESGALQGVIDVTTTEVADLVVGGVLACRDTRFDAVLERGLPMVLSVGALDMVNFGARDSVPSQHNGRLLHVHNEQVTLMRTTPEENRKVAAFITGKANRSRAPVRILFPNKGVSAIDVVGAPFHSPDADDALAEELDRLLDKSSGDRKLVRLPHHINDREFAAALVDTFFELAAHTLAPPAAAGATAAAGARSATAGANAERTQRIQQRVQPLLSSVFGSSSVEIPQLARRRAAILAQLRAQVAEGRAVIGGGAGTGISAKCEEAGGCDLIVIYNSGRFRMAGRGSLAGLLPFKDANGVVLEMASEVLPVVKRCPVLAGVCATDPFRVIPRFLKEVAEAGFAGVQNFPTVGLFDGVFRQNIEETGMGFSLEVDMIHAAAAMGFLTTPYAFTEDEARDMAAAGAHIVVAHMGLTTAGTIGAKTALTLEQSVARVQAIADAAREVRPDVMILCHGGPISGPKEAAYILERTRGVDGFYGASSMERLPTEVAMVDNLKAYKNIRLKPAGAASTDRSSGGASFFAAAAAAAPLVEPADDVSTPTGRIDRIQQRVQPSLRTVFGSSSVEIPQLASRRADILAQLRAQVAEGRAVIGGGAGTGISAKCEEAGGCDLIVIYNSGRFRMAGRGSLAGLLPFKDANGVVLEMASEVLPVVKRCPVLAGVCATDPFRVIPRFLREVAEAGFAGVQNFPTVGLFDGVFRQNIEETGMGFSLEVDMIHTAAAMGFLTTPYAFTEDEARDMAAAGAHIVVAHMGLTTAGTIGAKTALTLEQSVARVQAIADAAREVRPDVMILCHGGPISGPKEATYILERTRGVDGFYGASSMERLPTEVAMVDNLKAYKNIRLTPAQ